MAMGYFSFLLILSIVSLAPQALATCPCTSPSHGHKPHPPKTGPILLQSSASRQSPSLRYQSSDRSSASLQSPSSGTSRRTDHRQAASHPPSGTGRRTDHRQATGHAPPVPIVGPVIGPIIGKPPVTLPPVPVVGPVIGTPPTKKNPGCPTPPAPAKKCPADTVKLGLCLNVLGAIGGHIGDPAVECCPLSKGWTPRARHCACAQSSSSRCSALMSSCRSRGAAHSLWQDAASRLQLCLVEYKLQDRLIGRVGDLSET
ncbi:uncharacterized protein M6B38_155990 [Iris pallida]|uniref:Hydrophobic seed protein domain-containing protein n=1 Tax=Iris pallida TaxID=29817 RepID=A0AAX6F3I5_IRIPA|nr:uncharacterized protein M6B38_155990 [Iris pallida]